MGTFFGGRQSSTTGQRPGEVSMIEPAPARARARGDLQLDVNDPALLRYLNPTWDYRCLRAGDRMTITRQKRPSELAYECTLAFLWIMISCGITYIAYIGHAPAEGMLIPLFMLAVGLFALGNVLLRMVKVVIDRIEWDGERLEFCAGSGWLPLDKTGVVMARPDLQDLRITSVTSKQDTEYQVSAFAADGGQSRNLITYLDQDDAHWLLDRLQEAVTVGDERKAPLQSGVAPRPQASYAQIIILIKLTVVIPILFFVWKSVKHDQAEQATADALAARIAALPMNATKDQFDAVSKAVADLDQTVSAKRRRAADAAWHSWEVTYLARHGVAAPGQSLDLETPTGSGATPAITAPVSNAP